MTLNQQWLQNKIKGDLGEAICCAHFQAMGYKITKIGIENISPNKIYDEKIRIHLQKLPDFIATKNNQSLLIESKYINNIIKFNYLKYKLIWTYRNMIFTDTFIQIIKKEFKLSINDYSNDDFYKKNDVIMSQILDKFENREFSKLDIIFYIVVKEKKACYIYNSKFPNYLQSIDDDYYKKSNSITDHQFEGIHSNYIDIIQPVLDEIFS